MRQRFSLIIAHISIILLISVPLLSAADFNPGVFEDAFEITPGRQVVEAPIFEAVDLEGKVYRLSDFRPHIVVINFWATWCLPCIRELPQFEKLRQMLPADKYTILGINVRDRLSRVRQYLAGKDFQFKILLDTEGEIYKAYGVNRFPTTVIIGADGQLLAEIFGERDWTRAGFVEYLDYLRLKGKGEKE